MTKPIKDEREIEALEMHKLRAELIHYLDNEASLELPIGSLIRDIVFCVGTSLGCEKNPDGYKKAEKLFSDNFQYDH